MNPMTAWRHFSALEPGQRVLLLRAFWGLALARAGMAVFPVRRLVGARRGQTIQHDNGTEQQRRARAIGSAVRAAARHTPWNSACLAQALAAQRMLANENIGGTLFLGAELQGEAGTRELDAHAWVRCGEEFITGMQEHERFVVVSTFSW